MDAIWHFARELSNLPVRPANMTNARRCCSGSMPNCIIKISQRIYCYYTNKQSTEADAANKECIQFHKFPSPSTLCAVVSPCLSLHKLTNKNVSFFLGQRMWNNWIPCSSRLSLRAKLHEPNRRWMELAEREWKKNNTNQRLLKWIHGGAIVIADDPISWCECVRLLNGFSWCVH